MPGCSGWRVGFLCYVNFYSHAAANHPIDVSRGTSTPSEPNTQTKNWKETNPIANRGQTWNPILGSTRSPCSSSRFQFPSIPVSIFPSCQFPSRVPKLSARLLLFLWQLGSSWVTSNDFLCPPLLRSRSRQVGKPHYLPPWDPLSVGCARCGCERYVFGGVCVMRC